MSFTRLIPTLTLKDGRVVKTIRFDEYRDIGSPRTMGKVFDSQDVDELVLVDMTASQEGREPDWEAIQAFAEECAMPLTIGGGIRDVEIIRRLLRIGADKVVINSSAVRNPGLISEAANIFGAQCIVVAIDAKQISPEHHEVFIDGGYEPTGLDVLDWARRVEELGAGEIMLTSIDRDGTMEGYDLPLIRKVAEAVNLPVIASGGAGLLYDLLAGVREGRASAVACSSIFAFTDNKPIKAKAFMQDHGLAVRPI